MNSINIAKLFSIFTITLLVLSLSVVFQTPVAFACKCGQPGPPLPSLNEARAVFAGQVTNIDMPRVMISSADPVKVTFNVSQAWKGVEKQIITVSTVRDSVSCGYEFQAGEQYLVYARGDDNDLQVSLCSRTSLLAQAGDDLSALGKGEFVTGESEPVDKQLFNFTPTMLIIGGLTLAIVLLIGIIYRIFSSRRKIT